MAGLNLLILLDGAEEPVPLEGCTIKIKTENENGDIEYKEVGVELFDIIKET